MSHYISKISPPLVSSGSTIYSHTVSVHVRTQILPQPHTGRCQKLYTPSLRCVCWLDGAPWPKTTTTSDDDDDDDDNNGRKPAPSTRASRAPKLNGGHNRCLESNVLSRKHHSTLNGGGGVHNVRRRKREATPTHTHTRNRSQQQQQQQ